MLDFVDESFRKEDLPENILSIQLSLNGFSFCIRRSESRQLLVFKNHDVKISSRQLLARRFTDWLAEEPLLMPGYKQVNALVYDRHFTLIPQLFDSAEYRADISRLLFESTDEVSVSSPIEHTAANLCFHLPEELKIILEEHFYTHRLQHSLERVINRESSTVQQNRLCLLFDEKDMYFALFEKGKLCTCNVFRINHANDAVYFILTALQQLRLTAKSVSLNLAGQSSLLGDPLTVFGAYFENVDYLAVDNAEKARMEPKIIAGFPCLF